MALIIKIIQSTNMLSQSQVHFKSQAPFPICSLSSILMLLLRPDLNLSLCLTGLSASRHDPSYLSVSLQPQVLCSHALPTYCIFQWSCNSPSALPTFLALFSSSLPPSFLFVKYSTFAEKCIKSVHSLRNAHKLLSRLRNSML